jgi:hypothetical protein
LASFLRRIQARIGRQFAGRPGQARCLCHELILIRDTCVSPLLSVSARYRLLPGAENALLVASHRNVIGITDKISAQP